MRNKKNYPSNRYKSQVIDKEVVEKFCLEILKHITKEGITKTKESDDKIYSLSEDEKLRFWPVDRFNHHYSESSEDEYHNDSWIYLCENGKLFNLKFETTINHYSRKADSTFEFYEIAPESIEVLDYEPESADRDSYNWSRPGSQLKFYVKNKGDAFRGKLLGMISDDHTSAVKRKFPNLLSKTEVKPTHKGEVQKYFADKGFGFISCTTEKNDIFFHSSNIVSSKDNLSCEAGATVSFNLRKTKKGIAAWNIHIIG